MENKNAVYGNNVIIPLVAASGWLLLLIIFAFIFVIVSTLSWLSPFFMAYGLVLIFFLATIGVIYTVGLSISIAKSVEFVPISYILMKYITPVAKSIAKRTRLDVDKVVWSIITINNAFVLNKVIGKHVANIMILLPHCLQLQSCGLKLTSNVRNCKKCGKCIVNSLIELSDEFAVDIFVASGGTMARKQIMQKKPELILAVACERDLLSGIRDTLPLSVVGVINERPEGPCVNTTVDISMIKNLIKKIKG